MGRRGPAPRGPYVVSILDAESVRLGLPQVVHLRVNARNASLAGRYDAAARRALETGSEAPLLPFRNKTIVDLRGQRWPLITDFDAYAFAWGRLSDEEQDAFDFESP